MGFTSLLASLGLDIKLFNIGLDKAKANAAVFGESVKKNLSSSIKDSLGKYLLAGTAFGSFVALGEKLIENSREIKNWSEQLDISTDDVQRLMKVARRSGLEFEAMARGMEKFGEARLKALEGDPEKMALFQKFGLSMEYLKPNSTTNLEAISKIVGSVGGRPMTSGERVEIGELFGRHGERLIAPFERLAKMGPIKLIEERDVKALSDAKGSFDQIIKSLTIAASGPLAIMARELGRATGAYQDRRALTDQLKTAETTESIVSMAFPWIGDAAIKMSEMSGHGSKKLREMIEAMDAENRPEAMRNRKDSEPYNPDFAGPHADTSSKAPRLNLRSDSDNLAKVGLFVGGAGNPMVNIQQRQLQVAERQLDETRSLHRTISERL